MKTLARTCIALLLAAAAWGGQPMRGVQVSADGLTKISPLQGRADWSGDLAVKGPGFTVTGRGSAQMFAGPRLLRTSPGNVPLRAAEFSTSVEWISLIVTGDLKVTILGGGEPVAASRVVYVPEGRRLLIDGTETRLEGTGAED